jgi:type IV pilus assembly protein PilA
MNSALRSRTKLHTTTQLALLRSLRAKQMIAKGFTLVELMIVVAIVGILSAVALPQFLNARNAALAGARIGEGIGLAKECATSAASDINVGASTSSDPTNIAVSFDNGTDCIGGGTVTITFPSGAAGIRCLGATPSTSSNTNAVIDIRNNGAMTCTFGPTATP